MGLLILPSEKVKLSVIQFVSGNRKVWMDKSMNSILQRIPEYGNLVFWAILWHICKIVFPELLDFGEGIKFNLTVFALNFTQ